MLQTSRVHLTAASILMAAAVLASTLKYWPGWLPHARCPVHEFTGLLCPGCGTTRALTALTHGQFAEALHLNPLTTLLLPVVLAYGLLAYRRGLWGEALPVIPRLAIYALLVVAGGFMLLRNLA